MAETELRKDIARGRKESAIAYHQLHQVHLCLEKRFVCSTDMPSPPLANIIQLSEITGPDFSLPCLQ